MYFMEQRQKPQTGVKVAEKRETIASNLARVFAANITEL